jgi:hypothetical protein
MFPPNYQNIVNVPLNDETTSVKKKILKLLEKKNVKLKKNKKKSKG